MISNWKLHFGFQSVMIVLLIVMSALTIVITWSVYRKQAQLDSLQSQLSDLKTKKSEYQLLSEKGQANGYVPLNPNGTVPDKFLPAVPATVVTTKGCWDASTNTPTLVSSVGDPGEMYTVCVEGNYTLNGESEWKQHDRVFFLGGFIVSWVRLDGGRMSLNNTHDPVGNQQSLIVDMEGPVMTTRKVVGSSTMNVSLNSGQGVINFERGPNSLFFNQTTLTSIGGGSSLVLNGNGPNLTMRGFETTVQTPISPQFLTIDSDDHNIEIASYTEFLEGVTDILVDGTHSTVINPSHDLNHMYYFIGFTVWLHCTIFTMTQIDSRITFRIDTDSSTDPNINGLTYNDGQVGLVMSGTSDEQIFDASCGCFRFFTPFATTKGANVTKVYGEGGVDNPLISPTTNPTVSHTFSVNLYAPVFHGPT